MRLRTLGIAVALLIAAQDVIAAAEPAATRPAKPGDQADKPAADFAHPTPAGIEFFEKKIRPVLTQHCYKCHSAAASSIATRRSRPTMRTISNTPPAPLTRASSTWYGSTRKSLRIAGTP